MSSPALAIGWELWARNRTGIGGIAAGLVAAAILGAGLPAGTATDVMIPLSAVLFFLAILYLIAVAIHCEFDEGRLRVGLPARMFTLPVRTRALVGWLMLYGLGGLAALWLATVVLIWLPVGIEPAWWLVPLLAVTVIWLQAVCWAAPGPPLARIVALCVIFPALKFALEMIALGVVLYVYHEPWVDQETLVRARPVVLTLFAGFFIPLGYVAAVAGVSRTRRGSAGRQGWTFGHLRRQGSTGSRGAAFRSPARALIWFEWRRKGYVLPIFSACSLLYLAIVVGPNLIGNGLMIGTAVVLGLVVVVAFFAGYGFGKKGFWGRDLDLSVFQSCHPVTSTTLAFARVRAAGLSALTTTAVFAVGITIWLGLLGRGDEAIEWVSGQLPGTAGLSPGILVGLGAVALFVLTWGQLVGGMVPALTGRPWVVNGVVGGYVALVIGLGVLVRHVVLNPDALDPCIRATTWVIWCLIGVKLAAAIVAVRAATRHDFLTRPLALTLLISWAVIVLALVVLADLLLPPITRPLAITAALFVPLVRAAVAPLALTWNRHR